MLLLGAMLLVRFTTSGDVWNQPASRGSVGVDPRFMKAFAAREWFMETFFSASLASMVPAPAAAHLHWGLGLHYLTTGEPGLAETEFTETASYLPVLRHRADHATQP